MDVIRNSIIAVMPLLTWDYQTRIGIEKTKAEEVLDSWPTFSDANTLSNVFLLVHNSLNDLLYGVGLKEDEITSEVGCSRDDLVAIFEKWKAVTNRAGIQ